MKRFAFIVMGDFDPSKDRAEISGGAVNFICVSSVDEACAEAAALAKEGEICVELCGAFGEAGARRVIEATGGKIPVGFVTHLPEQDELFEEFFSRG